MADFAPFFPKLISDESLKITNNKGDIGGLTIAGISQHSFPNHPIFAMIKELGLSVGDNFPISRIEIVKQFYKATFWDKCWCDGINSQESAESIANFAVNTGVVSAIKLAQTALSVEITGKMNQDTLGALNNVNDFSL